MRAIKTEHMLIRWSVWWLQNLCAAREQRSTRSLSTRNGLISDEIAEHSEELWHSWLGKRPRDHIKPLSTPQQIRHTGKRKRRQQKNYNTVDTGRDTFPFGHLESVPSSASQGLPSTPDVTLVLETPLCGLDCGLHTKHQFNLIWRSFSSRFEFPDFHNNDILVLVATGASKYSGIW